MNNKKKIILSILVVLLLLVVGVTYAFFTYESGTKSDIVTGQIYMNYEETSTISLTGVFPETKEQALARQDENGVFEFTITGRNTSKYPVYYEIDLLEGGVMTGKTEQSTRLLPEHVRIYLERDGEPLVDGMRYKDWNNRRIYVDTVPEGTTSNIEHKYTLRMWIDENVTISDTDPDADYTTTEWNDAYTSLKVRVVGDFEWKEAATDASCFAYNVIDDPNVITYDYLTGITLDTSEEKVEACMVNMIGDGGPGQGNDLSTEQDGYKGFCEGTGTYVDQQFGTINLNQFVNSYLGLGVPADFIMELIPVVNITTETRYYELNTSEESVNTCVAYLETNWGPEEEGNTVGGGETYEAFCSGTGTNWGDTFVDFGNDNDWYISDIDYFATNNILTQLETPQGEIEITDYDESCGLDVIIPSTIEGLPVTRIADSVNMIPMSYYGDDNKNITLENNFNKTPTIKVSNSVYNAFNKKGITSIKFPSTLKYIGDYAFDSNNLSEVIIPDSVKEIGDYAFRENDITNIEIGTGITSIGDYAFYYSPLVTVNVKGNPILGSKSFSTYSDYYPNDVFNFQTFRYGGTCEELNQNSDIFISSSHPQQIITSDTNSCTYTGPTTTS